ncbi:MAG: acetate--CoA ligase family protein [Deltaproteobacteria bacterium]|nr:acetate--CoA ligase family protein [Deltaproteobacteria bacterium]
MEAAKSTKITEDGRRLSAAGPIDIIGKVRSEGRLTMTEAESKDLLKWYDVPIVEEFIAKTVREALTQARLMGFPVVLKGLGARLMHKTEKGLVKLNLGSMQDIRNACREIRASAGADLEGYLLQPMLKGRRELVAGLFRDPQFGPVVMFGLGGIFTEAMGDVVFRIAPLNEIQAQDMIDELISKKLLGPFRGESAADRKKLVKVLMGLSRLGMDVTDVKEVDINPLLVDPDGQVTAVDALVVLSQENETAGIHDLSEEELREQVSKTNAALDVMFDPKSLAVVGATRSSRNGFPGMFNRIADFGFAGRLYPINPNTDDVDGYKAYPSLVSLPEPADLVIISVPAPAVPDALRDCAASGSRNVHIFTAGFKETGEEEGVRLQEELEQIAREGGLRVIGPNCMGLYVPKSRLLTWMIASKESGPAAFISQSGGHAQDFTHYATNQFGIRFNKAISFGNALTLDSTDFLAYLDGDEETKIIAMYLEGVKDGRRLLNLISKINRKKPIILLKGGLTESGARAVASHTGSMAGGEKIWNALYRQTGAIRVDSLEQMADVALAFLNLGEAKGPGVAVVGTGGGVGVAAADSCARVGLELPPLPEEMRRKIREFTPPAGTMIRNPIDNHYAFMNLDILGRTLDLLADAPYIDMFILALHLDWFFSVDEGGQIERIGEYIVNKVRAHANGKPVVVVWRQYQPVPEIKEVRVRLEKTLLKGGIPVYEGLPRAAFALSKLYEYHAFLRRNG